MQKRLYCYWRKVCEVTWNLPSVNPQQDNLMAPLLKALQSILFSFLDLWSTVQQAKFTQAFYLELQSGSLQHFLYSSKYILYFR